MFLKPISIVFRRRPFLFSQFPDVHLFMRYSFMQEVRNCSRRNQRGILRKRVTILKVSQVSDEPLEIRRNHEYRAFSMRGKNTRPFSRPSSVQNMFANSGSYKRTHIFQIFHDPPHDAWLSAALCDNAHVPCSDDCVCMCAV